MSRYHVTVWSLEHCKDCDVLTLWSCMACHKPVCPMCEFSMHAMCRDCRAAYHGPIWQLGAKADAYIRSGLERLMPA